MLQDGATHVGVATDHVIESFRNDMWPAYKSSAGMDPLLLAQFDWLEDALRALGVAVWPMVDVEADDGLASAAVVAAADPRVEQVIICTPDKDLGQCVGGKVIQLDRRQDKLIDADGVIAKFGVPAESIPDWLALVGDSADGFPGLPGFGAKSAATLLARYGHLEDIPAKAEDWDVTVRGATKLAATLVSQRADADTFKLLATVRTDAAVGTVDDWDWTGPAEDFPAWCEIRLAASGEGCRRLGRRPMTPCRSADHDGHQCELDSAQPKRRGLRLRELAAGHRARAAAQVHRLTVQTGHQTARPGAAAADRALIPTCSNKERTHDSQLAVSGSPPRPMEMRLMSPVVVMSVLPCWGPGAPASASSDGSSTRPAPVGWSSGCPSRTGW
jgi:5'-3' exonuclease